jgi:hypothetical protein
MSIIGVIRAAPGGPAFRHEAWCEFLRRRPELVQPVPKRGRNPFTNEPCIIRPAPDTAAVVIDGREVGDVCWSHTGEDEVIVSGDRAAVGPLARQLAAALGAQFDELPA